MCPAKDLWPVTAVLDSTTHTVSFPSTVTSYTVSGVASQPKLSLLLLALQVSLVPSWHLLITW